MWSTKQDPRRTWNGCARSSTAEPDVVHAHYLLRWPYVASLIDRRPLVATPWGSDLYVATGDDRRRAEYVPATRTWWLPAHPICGASCCARSPRGADPAG